MEEAEKTEKLTVMAGKTLEHSGAHGGDGEGGGEGSNARIREKEKRKKRKGVQGEITAREQRKG